MTPSQIAEGEKWDNDLQVVWSAHSLGVAKDCKRHILDAPTMVMDINSIERV